MDLGDHGDQQYPDYLELQGYRTYLHYQFVLGYQVILLSLLHRRDHLDLNLLGFPKISKENIRNLQLIFFSNSLILIVYLKTLKILQTDEKATQGRGFFCFTWYSHVNKKLPTRLHCVE